MTTSKKTVATMAMRLRKYITHKVKVQPVSLEKDCERADVLPYVYAWEWKRHVAAAIIQRMVRGHLARKTVAVMKSESMSEDTMDPVYESESWNEKFVDYPLEERVNDEYPMEDGVDDYDVREHLARHWIGFG